MEHFVPFSNAISQELTMLDSLFVNPHISWSEYQRRYASAGRVQIMEFLLPSAANEITALVKSRLPWILEYREAGQSRRLSEHDFGAMSAVDRASFTHRIDSLAREDFQFAYFSCSLAPENISQFPAGHGVQGLAQKIVSHDFVSMMREFIGDPAVRGLTASFTRYDPGQYLLPHDDTDSREDRRAAYVLNLSEDWWPDWGGLLQFIDDRRNVVESFSPHNASLAVFKVPQLHAVSYVAPYALRPRYAITGWLIA